MSRYRKLTVSRKSRTNAWNFSQYSISKCWNCNFVELLARAFRLGAQVLCVIGIWKRHRWSLKKYARNKRQSLMIVVNDSLLIINRNECKLLMKADISWDFECLSSMPITEFYWARLKSQSIFSSSEQNIFILTT